MAGIRDVILPQILPAILSGVLLAFAMSFDDVVISIFVTGPKVNTLPVKIYTKLKDRCDTGDQRTCNSHAVCDIVVSGASAGTYSQLIIMGK